jgi:enoyl-CoA hydratase
MNQTSNIPAQFEADADIAFTRHGRAIDVRLTRPKALNALTHNMAKALYAGLKLWAKDDTISHVVVSADPGEKKAFCAGGDIRDLYEGHKAASPRYTFFRDEYRLNEAIAIFPKPYIALIDGMVMGGGAGISMHGSHRIVTENARFAMPEVGIGLIPDVGGSFVLPRLKNHFGFLLGLSGTLVGPEECLEAGIATHYCAANEIEQLRARLLSAENPKALINALRKKPIHNLLRHNKTDIKKVFSAKTLRNVFESLETISQDNPLLAGALKRMKLASPLSLCLAFEQLKRCKGLTLREGLIMEYRLVSRILYGPDLYEGIRSAIIDRSTPARWQHASIDDVDLKLVESYFTSPPDGDLTFEKV